MHRNAVTCLDIWNWFLSQFAAMTATNPNYQMPQIAFYYIVEKRHIALNDKSLGDLFDIEYSVLNQAVINSYARRSNKIWLQSDDIYFVKQIGKSNGLQSALVKYDRLKLWQCNERCKLYKFSLPQRSVTWNHRMLEYILNFYVNDKQ